MTPRWAVGLVALALVAGCGGAGRPGSDRSGTDRSDVTFTNPVYDANFPDPGVLKVGETYYAYGTTDGVRNVPLLTSKDLVHWSEPVETLPELPQTAAHVMHILGYRLACRNTRLRRSTQESDVTAAETSG